MGFFDRLNASEFSPSISCFFVRGIFPILHNVSRPPPLLPFQFRLLPPPLVCSPHRLLIISCPIPNPILPTRNHTPTHHTTRFPNCPIWTQSANNHLPNPEIELFKLEQRYTKRKRRTTFISEAIYIDGEYIYTHEPHPSKVSSPTTSTKSSSGWSARVTEFSTPPRR